MIPYVIMCLFSSMTSLFTFHVVILLLDLWGHYCISYFSHLLTWSVTLLFSRWNV